MRVYGVHVYDNVFIYIYIIYMDTSILAAPRQRDSPGPGLPAAAAAAAGRGGLEGGEEAAVVAELPRAAGRRRAIRAEIRGGVGDDAPTPTRPSRSQRIVRVGVGRE